MGFINSSKGTNSLFVGNIVHHLCSSLPMSHTSTLPAFFNHYFLPTGCICWINWGKIWFSTLQIGKIKETIKIKNKNTKDGDALQKNTIFAHENQGSILNIAVAIRRRKRSLQHNVENNKYRGQKTTTSIHILIRLAWAQVPWSYVPWRYFSTVFEITLWFPLFLAQDIYSPQIVAVIKNWLVVLVIFF